MNPIAGGLWRQGETLYGLLATQQRPGRTFPQASFHDPAGSHGFRILKAAGDKLNGRGQATGAFFPTGSPSWAPTFDL
jgi:hypothetical protein